MNVNNVRILNGGYNAWLRKNYPIEKKINNRKPIEFKDERLPILTNYIVDIEFVQDIVNNLEVFSDQYSLIDIRSWQEHIGEISGYSDLNITGRIPGSQWGKAGSDVNQLEDYRNADLTMRSAGDIRKMWDSLGINYTNKHLIFYCGSGIFNFRNLNLK